MRHVHPFRLVRWSRRWYLVAWDVEPAEWPTFRLDRIARVRPAGTRVRTGPPPDDPIAFVAEAARDAWRYTVTVRLPTDVKTAAMLVDPTRGALRPDGDGCLLDIGTDDVHWAARRIAALDLDVQVVGPPAFREALASLGRYLVALAGEAVPPTTSGAAPAPPER